MGVRRYTRLTNAFSKKLENQVAATASHFAHYDLVRRHQSLRVTPAMAADVAATSLQEGVGFRLGQSLHVLEEGCLCYFSGPLEAHADSERTAFLLEFEGP